MSLATALAAFAGFAYLGVAEDAYGLSYMRGHHGETVVLRKAYSILAFAALGYIFCTAGKLGGRRLSLAGASAAVAASSGLIEMLQFAHGSREGLLWSAFDVACGAVGGWMGAALNRALEIERPE